MLVINFPEFIIIIDSANIYLIKTNNRNTRKRCELWSSYNKNTRRRFGVFIVNFEHISHLFLVFLLLTLNK